MMNTIKKNGEKQQKFSDLSSHLELRDYLIKKANRLNNTADGMKKYMCDYTDLTAAIGIIMGKMWFVGSPFNMNDGLELSHGDNSIWKSVFFASFMLEPKESIAMWSMYAQPWNKGVMLRIPVEQFKKLAKENPRVFVADKRTKKANRDKQIYDARVSSYAVAYTNADSKSKKETETLMCGYETNQNIFNVLESNQLVGYIKDSAWSYENEYRLRVDTASNKEYEAVAIELSDDFVDSIEIVSGPRFEGELLQRIEEEIGNMVAETRVRKSIFDKKLNWVYCDSCKKPKIDNEIE